MVERGRSEEEARSAGPGRGDGDADRRARIVGCLGQTGTGKTYEAIQQVSHDPRVLFFDTVCNTAGDGPRHNDLPPGFVHLWSFSAFLEWMRPRVWQHGRIGHRFQAAFHPGTGSVLVDGKERQRAEVEFDWFCAFAFEIGYLTVVVDEVWRFTLSNWMPAPLSDLVFTGGHRAVRLVYTAQRPNRVAVDLLSQTGQFEIFRIKQQHDLLALRTQLAPAALDLVPSLPDRSRISRGEDDSWCLVRG